ncbi:sodium:proton exchanger [Frankia casuarinae]|nr:sodium:proton exchanger [Frankia casuarinae]ORT96882.1 sodium:proton exchanger [Frankia casuarinae]
MPVPAASADRIAGARATGATGDDEVSGIRYPVSVIPALGWPVADAPAGRRTSAWSPRRRQWWRDVRGETLSLTSTRPVPSIPPHSLLLFLLQLAMLLSLAILLGRVAVRLRMPAIVGELCVGVLLGPSLLGTLWPTFSDWFLPRDAAQFHLLDAVGQLGVLFLVALSGFEIDTRIIRRRSLTVARISLGGLLLPLGFGIVTGVLMPSSLLGPDGDRTVFALFLGVAMCVSAIPVMAKTLMEMRLTHREVGQLALAGGVIDDAVGWLMLAVVSAMATTGVRAGDTALSVLYVLGVGIFALTIGRVVVRAVLGRIIATSGAGAGAGADPGARSGSVVAFVAVLVLASAAGTQALELEAVFGAFLGGVVLGSSGLVDHASVAPLRIVVMAVLAPIFFATAGLRVDLTALSETRVLLAAVIVLAVAVFGKFAGVYAGARASRLTPWEGLALGAGMNARGVIEIVVASVGVRLGVLSTETYTIIVLVAIVTSVMAPPILRRAMRQVEQTAAEEQRRLVLDGHHASGAGGVGAAEAGVITRRETRTLPAARSRARYRRSVNPSNTTGRDGLEFEDESAG